MSAVNVVSVQHYKDQFVESVTERIKTKDELGRFLHAIDTHFAETANAELRETLSEIHERVLEKRK